MLSLRSPYLLASPRPCVSPRHLSPLSFYLFQLVITPLTLLSTVLFFACFFSDFFDGFFLLFYSFSYTRVFPYIALTNLMSILFLSLIWKVCPILSKLTSFQSFPCHVLFSSLLVLYFLSPCIHFLALFASLPCLCVSRPPLCKPFLVCHLFFLSLSLYLVSRLYLPLVIVYRLIFCR